MTTDPIKKILTAGGETRYRFIIDMGKKPDGKRDQRCFTFRTQKEARAERSRIISDRARGTLVKPSKFTVGEAIDKWLDGRRNLRPGTARNYRYSLGMVSSHLGHVQLQALSKAHLDRMVSELLDHGRRSGNVKTQQLSPRTINLALTLLSSVLEDAVRQGSLSRNVAKMVEHPRQTRKDMQTWTAEQAGAFLDAVADHRLSAAFQLSMYGLRRGEVLGLTWDDIDLQARTLTVRRARVEVGGVVVEGEPKTERGRRTLPLDEPMVASLRALRTQQKRERWAASEAYTPACSDCGGEHLVVDEIGRPVRPELYSDTFQKLSRAAGLPVIRLHDARHTSVTLMILNGVQVPVVSKWHGHASAAFTMNNYAHSQDDALTAAGALLGSVIRKSQGRSERNVNGAAAPTAR